MKDLCQLFTDQMHKLTLCLLLLMTNTAIAEVKPPNYNFSLDKFTLFLPGAKLVDIEKEYPTKELVLKKGSYLTYKFYIEHVRYRFAILVQVQAGVVTDFHARLPPYFLHDIFHQSLINRYGKQDKYKNNKEQSIYEWTQQAGRVHTYVGACTITCFPIYYSVRNSEIKSRGDYSPILEQLFQSEAKTRQLPDS